MAEPFVARVSRPKTALLMLLSIGMAGLGAWCAISFDFVDRPKAVIAGWFALIFFGLGALVIARQLFRAGPVMTIDRNGIRWMRWSDATIPWTAITRAESQSIRGQRFLALWLRDPELYPRRTTLGLLTNVNKAMGFGDLALSAQGLDRNFDQLLDAVRAHAPQPLGASL